MNILAPSSLALASLPVVSIAVADIDPCPWNVRKTSGLTPEKLEELAKSLVARGQLEAVLVRPHPTEGGRYQLANGERRYRASLLRPRELPMLAAKVKEMSDAEVLDVMLASGGEGNVEPLAPLEEAEGFEHCMQLRKLTLEQLAAHVGRPVTYVHRRLALLDLPVRSRKALESGELPAITAWRIARIPGVKPREDAEKAVLSRPVHGGVMSEREAADYIETNICRSLQGAIFDTKDAVLVPDAGACATCRYNAANNAEEYGDVGKKTTCMSPGCYASKVAAHHARVLAKAAVGGKIGLTWEENARTYVEGERGLHFAAEFVVWNQPPTLDLLKREVTSAPKWSELCEGRGVQVYIGMHQDGYAVELVKLGEAIAVASEVTLFNDETMQRHGRAEEASIVKASRSGKTAEQIADAKKLPVDHVKVVIERSVGPAAAAGPAEGSHAAEEAAEARRRKKEEKLQKAKDKASGEWLGELFDVLAEAPGRPAWETLAYWTLEYDLAAEALTKEEIAYLLKVVGDDTETERPTLDAHAHGLKVRELFALVALMKLTPRVRAAGVDCELVKEWHQTLMMPDAPAASEMPEEEKAKWAEIVKAHAAGMDVREIARSWDVPLPEVCGALGVPVPADDAIGADVQALQARLPAAFEAAGILRETDKESAAKLACKCKLTEVDTVPRLEALLALLGRLAEAKATKEKKPAPAPES